MKKIIASILMIFVCLSMFAGCGSKKEDWDYLQEKGKLVIGYTIYQPMNYEENGELVGFDTEFAKAVCAELGLTPVFQEIDWEAKILDLNDKTIDCIGTVFYGRWERKAGGFHRFLPCQQAGCRH